MITLKLLQLQASTRSLAKDTKANSYTYVSGSKVLGQIRPKMDELGILLTQEILEITNTPITYATLKGNRTEIFTTIKIRFTWIDSEDDSRLVNDFYANGMNAFDKGLGSALTYAERYYLLKTFHIATEEDDVDAIAREEDVTITTHPQAQPQPANDVEDYVSRAIAEVNAVTSTEMLNQVWAKYQPRLGKNAEFVKAVVNNKYNLRGGRTNA